MAFIIGGEDEDGEVLREIERATECGITMICSAYEEGPMIAEAWPAAYHAPSRSLITLAACDENGKVLREADEKTYDYLIKGEYVAPGSEDTITGSSVSTALAAGLSSLILMCDRLRNPEKKYETGTKDGSRYELIRSRLDQMRAPKSKFVPLDSFIIMTAKCGASVVG